MNRRERRKMQKDLGLNEHYKKETRDKKFQRWRDNMENGNRMQKEMKEMVETLQNMTEEEKQSATIAILAEKIARQKNIPLIDAMSEAKEEYDKLIK